MLGFNSKEDKKNYILFCVMVFIFSISYSTQAYLAVILKHNGFDKAQLGNLFFAALFPFFVSTFFSGKLVDLLSEKIVFLIGAWTIFLAQISYQFTQYNYILTMGSRAMVACGYGFFFSAGAMYVKSKLSQKSGVYYFGIYASTIPLAFVFGPALAELVYKAEPNGYFFIYSTIPMLLSFMVFLFLSKSPKKQIEKTKLIDFKNYFSSFKDTDMRKASFAILLNGLIWGFIPSFMAYYLKETSIQVGFFFIPFAIGLFSSRFIFMQKLQKISKPILAFLGFFIMCNAYFWLAFFQNSTATVVVAFSFGVGYSVMYPSIIFWATKTANKNNRATRVSLFNLIFNIGIYSSPLLIGVLSDVLSISMFLKSLAIIILIAATILLSFDFKRKFLKKKTL